MCTVSALITTALSTGLAVRQMSKEKKKTNNQINAIRQQTTNQQTYGEKAKTYQENLNTLSKIPTKKVDEKLPIPNKPFIQQNSNQQLQTGLNLGG